MAQHKTYLEQAIEDGHAKITGDGKTQRIHYNAASHSERWSDPEEKVRAEFWAELIYKYQYRPERIRFEMKVPRRTPNDLADLVIYDQKDDELKSPWFVFECKRADVSDAEFVQAIEQACGNRASLGANYAGTIAGLTRRLLRFDKFPAGERDKNIMTDIPVRYGKPPEWRFYKNETGKDLAAIPREELRSAIRKCHQTLWEGGRRSPIAAFGEFCKLIFVKHRDEKNPDREDGKPYAFQRRDGETVEELAARIHRLYDAEKSADPTVFEGKINIEPAILAQCVEHLEGISLDRTELDTKGVAFEEFMGGFFKGDFGQYFTPRELIAFAVEVLNPDRKDLTLDPACGSGGFLLYALDHVRREANRKKKPGSVEHFRYWHDYAEKKLFGLEINEELARVAKMNMIIHDDGHTNIVGHDALDFFEQPMSADGKPKGPSREYILDKNKGLKPGSFDLILTNPPFGSVVKRTEKADGYLEQFELRNFLSKSTTKNEDEPDSKSLLNEKDAKRGGKNAKDRASIKTEILFLERVHSFLKPGTGRVAIVLPDGMLTNSSLQGVRDWLLAHFQLLGVVSLPQFAFAHYDELATCIFSGVTPLAKGDAYVPPPDGVRFIRSGEITADGEVTPISEIHLSATIHNGMMKRSQLESGDLLIAIVGATIGAAGVFNHDEPANINQAIAAVRLIDAGISPEFACLYLRSSIGQALLDYFKRPVARANINLEEIGDIPLIIPPKDVQEDIVVESHRRREEARRLCAEADAGWQAAKHWFEEQLLGSVRP